jgi:SPX domain protein involved in polyphosphate accumulation
MALSSSAAAAASATTSDYNSSSSSSSSSGFNQTSENKQLLLLQVNNETNNNNNNNNTAKRRPLRELLKVADPSALSLRERHERMHAEFYTLLESSVRTIQAFYSAQLVHLTNLLSRAHLQFLEKCAGGQSFDVDERKTKKALARVSATTHNVRHDLVLLQSFLEVNREGIRKIIKKHSKNFKCRARDRRVLLHLQKHYSFHKGNGLAKLNKRATALCSQVARRNVQSSTAV